MTLKPGQRFVGAVAPPHAQHDQPRALGAQPGDDLSAPLLAVFEVLQPGDGGGW